MSESQQACSNRTLIKIPSHVEKSHIISKVTNQIVPQFNNGEDHMQRVQDPIFFSSNNNHLYARRGGGGGTCQRRMTLSS